MDDIEEFNYKIKDYDDINDAKRLSIVEKIKEIGGVLDAKFIDEEKSLKYIIDKKASSYEVFSALMELLDKEQIELIFDDEKIIDEKVETESEEIANDDDGNEEKNKSAKEKKYERAENIIVLSLSAALIVVGFILDKIGLGAARWVYMFGYAFAGYETLYSMITDIAEKRYAGEKILVLVASFALLFMGNGLLGSVVLFGFSLMSCLYSTVGNFAERLKSLGLSDDSIKESLGENDYLKKKKNLIYDVVVVAIGLMIVFLLPLTQINQYWSILTQKWLNIGICFIVLALMGFMTKSVIANYVFVRFYAGSLGVKIMDNAAIDKLNAVSRVVFDKTGVLTENEGKIVEIKGNKEELGAIILSAEKALKDPVAKVLTDYFKDIEPLVAQNIEYTEGRGVSFECDGCKYFVGSKKYLSKQNIGIDDVVEYSAVYVAKDDDLLGSVYIDFPVKDDAEGVVTELKEDIGVESEIFSSDSVKAVEKVKKSIGAKNAVAGASAEYKIENADKDGILYVGNSDGDREVLERLGLSVAFGATDKELEKAAINVENDDIRLIPSLLKSARRMKKIENQNKIVGFAFKALSFTLGLMLSLLLKNYDYAIFWAIVGGIIGDVIVFLNSCRNLTEAV